MSRPGKRASQPGSTDASQFKQLSTWVHEDVAKEIAQRAAAEKTSKRAVVTAALSAYLGKVKPEADEDAED